MRTYARTGAYTFSDFLELVHEDQKADLLDGNILMASPESIGHNSLVKWLTVLIDQFVEQRNLGLVTVNKVAYRLSKTDAPEPDVAFVSADRRAIVKPGYIDGPPDLAIEIISPDSVERDYEDKRKRYEQFGVREYWIVDPEERTVTMLRNSPAGFEEIVVRDQILESSVLTGLRIDVRWLWQNPLPPVLPILKQLLDQ